MVRHLLNGRRFTRLTVIDSYRSGRRVYWRCICDCGRGTIATTDQLNAGRVKSCGCLKVDLLRARSTTHAGCRTSEYTVWQGMRARCYNPREPAYQNYGARGIQICPQWRHDFAAFRTDMGARPPGSTIERLDNDGPYAPENCVWSTRLAQARNKRNNRWLTYDGLTLTITEWSRRIGINCSTLIERLQHTNKPLDWILRPASK